ncbi:fimbria/pilus chaperone family protein [Burkholderia sp. Ac-20344]|uniref:fimbria/pilus chaperone family protein n=1 Tax=Burkholderia sp. Ac-20344 TaxID=2703890 RepID=UPI00197B2C7E|nr:fimbria/pilus chaperone family protein [Burkholderia sp. Ac-20344]MBN3836267.1 fimbria/pilus periplasmic chaperone [Burkholderia sp. Ac-20344]
MSISRAVWLAMLMAASLSSLAYASGVQPETSVVVVSEADGEASMIVTNTDAQPALLYTTIQHLPEDPEPLLTVTPPVARVEPRQSQLVRFVLTSPTPLKTERLERVTFEGIPPGNDTTQSRVQITVRQSLPVLLHPQGLKMVDDPWTRLQWSFQHGTLSVSNPSPYVVRLAQQAMLLPSHTPLLLPHPYVLPGERVGIARAPVQADRAHQFAQPGAVAPLPDGASGVRINPATTYGFAVAHYDAPLVTSSAPNS